MSRAVRFVDRILNEGNWSNKEFVKYLTGTLIPDLKESGYIETAKDFETVVHVLKNKKLPDSSKETWDTVEDFIGYLTETLIPDLKESGSTATAEDFEDAVELMNKTVNEAKAVAAAKVKPEKLFKPFTPPAHEEPPSPIPAKPEMKKKRKK